MTTDASQRSHAATLLAAVPALAQTYNQSYYAPSYPSYPTYTPPPSQQYFGYGCPNLTYNLVRGSSDYYTQGQVSQLQSFLRSRYNDSRLTGGYYGALTASYVARFQQEMGVYPVTGGVGPLTRAAIQRACGGYPNPNPYPTPTPSMTTFRLDRNFTLYDGDSARLTNGQLEVSLEDTDTRNNEATFDLTIACRAGTYCIYAPTRRYTLEEGDSVAFQGFDVELVSVASGRATFRVTDTSSSNNATIDLTRPTSSDDVNQGDTQRIAWSTSDEPTDSSVVLDLYTSGGSKVGTIAITSDTDGSYSWHVPVRGTFCIQQYPNGLCGYDLDGRYYIKASLVEGTGFNGGATLDSDTSGTFTINR